MRDLLILVVIGLGTYAMRAAFLVKARTEPPARVARVLPYVGPAVLAAITVPALLAPDGGFSAVGTPFSVLAAAVAGLLWWRRRSLPIALFAGLGVWSLAAAVGNFA